VLDLGVGFGLLKDRWQNSPWRWPIVGMLVVIATGLLYSLWLGQYISPEAIPGWVTPGDIWFTLRSSSDIYYGQFRYIYVGDGLVTFPGIAVLFLPVIYISNVFGLTQNYPFNLQHPTTWLMLGPYELILGSLVLIPLYQVSMRLGLSYRRRLVLLGVEVAAVWQVCALWGHPEDSISVAFALWAIIAMWDKHYKGSAWLWGLAIAMQPLVLLVLILWFAVMPLRRWVSSIWRIAIIPSLLILGPLVRAPHETLYSLIKQPQTVHVNHATPWISTAPVLGYNHPKHYVTGRVAGKFKFHQVVLPGKYPMVSAGLGRSIGVALALLVGLILLSYLSQHPTKRIDPIAFIWLCGVAFYLRILTESVLVPYYMWPATAFLLLALAMVRYKHLLYIAPLQLGSIIYSYFHLNPWVYWIPIQIVFLLTIWVSRPSLWFLQSDTATKVVEDDAKDLQLVSTSPIDYTSLSNDT